MEVILASISDSTIKQYDSALRTWWQFNYEKGMDPYKYTIPKVVNFLTEKFNQNHSYGSLNSIRSALSFLLGPELGQNQTIKRFFKGVARLRPLQPKYNKTWDPAIVLNFLSNWFPHTTLDMYKLSKKLVTLLAIITAHRVQTLSLIKLSNIVVLKDKIEIMISDHIKTSALGKRQPLLIVPFYNQNPNICPARCLYDYIERTKQLRNDYSNDSLFISPKMPHQPVSSQTISKWIKGILRESGLDISIFTAHSTRHASTSAALRLGVSIDLIRSTAGWTRTSETFARFYNRPITTDSSKFARTLLSKLDTSNK